jgi:hypothetical protein
LRALGAHGNTLDKATDVPAIPIDFGWTTNPHSAVCRDNPGVTDIEFAKARREDFIFL